MSKAITLLSGGLDSTVATVMARPDYDIVLALTFDYGQRSAGKEAEASQNICGQLGIRPLVVELPWLGKITETALVNRAIDVPKVLPEALGHGDETRATEVWVPNRNGVFVAIAAAFAESLACSTVIAGFNSEEAKTFPDNSVEFVASANAELKLSTKNGVTLISPTLKMTKDEIASHFVSQNLDPNMFWCCYEGQDKLCGRCESCARTIRAFKKVGAWEVIQGRFEK